MKQRFLAGMILVSSVALMTNCGGDDSGSGTSGAGGSGGSGGSSAGSGGSGGSTGGTSAGGSGGDGSGGSAAGSGGSAAGSGGSAAGSGGSAAGSGGSAGETGTAGEGGGAGDGAGGGPVACPSAIGGLAEAFAEAVCRKRVECCTDDYESCITEMVSALDEDLYPDAGAAVEAGTAELNCTAFDSCAAAIDAADCADWPLQEGTFGGIPVDEPACRQMVTPLIADGDECTYNYECIDGLCRASEDGLCYAFAAENAACGDGLDQVCNPATMFCNDDSVCQLHLANGEECTDNLNCESRLCDTDDTGLCVAPGADQCLYVPVNAPSCSVSGSFGAAHAPFGVPLMLGLAGLGAMAARRRRKQG